MRIVLVTNWYSENMGYSENILPKALANLGHEVNVISSTAQVYYNSPFYKQTYENYLGPGIVGEGEKEIDGYKLHRLHFQKHPFILRDLVKKVAELKPEIVQTFDIDINVYQLAKAQNDLGFRLFTELHLHASVFPNYKSRGLMARMKWYWRLGKHLNLINSKTVLCYPIADDCADIAKVIYKVPQTKIKVQSLGTDTQLFKPCTTSLELDQRLKTRTALGFSPRNIVCIYTGRITKDKGPSVLARAISFLLEQGHSEFRALFIGIGEEDEMQIIRESKGCVIKDFVRANELPKYYQASDIAVWPFQESTSQLDAIACGLPLIVNDTVTVHQRVEGNGLFYKSGSVSDLASKLLDLISEDTRKELGASGTEKAKEHFSWIKLAKERIIDYQGIIKATDQSKFTT